MYTFSMSRHRNKTSENWLTILFPCRDFVPTEQPHVQTNFPAASLVSDPQSPTPKPSAQNEMNLLATPTATQSSLISYKVVGITDGDTFKVAINGKTETVRIVGINTPETVPVRKAPECYGKEASDKLKMLLENKYVTLTSDSTQSDRDKYGRLLRFVAVDGADIGFIMIREGYAYESLYSTIPHMFRTTYVRAQKIRPDRKKKGCG